MLLGVGYALSISSCRDCEDPTNPECSNYDPCWDWIEPSFEMGTAYINRSEVVKFQGDTALYGNVYFEANIENAISYEWTIGTDTRTWDTKEFSLYFKYGDSLILRNQPILIQLIIHRRPNLICRPNDDGIDTISRYLHFRSNWEAAIWGKWEGYRDNLTNDIYRIKIKRDSSTMYPYGGTKADYIYNLYNEGEDCYHTFENSRLAYRYLTTNEHGRGWNAEECGSPYDDSHVWTRKFNILINTTENTISMSWLEVGRDSEGDCCYETPHTFYGHRIQ